MDLWPQHQDRGSFAGSVRILDIRSRREFEAGHLPGAVSHPVVAGAGTIPAKAHFEAILPSIYLPPREMPLLVVGSDAELTEALAAHLTGRGRAQVHSVLASEIPAADFTARGAASGHLWAAPEWLTRHEAVLPPPAAGPVLDLACGSGRAAVWLAERGYRVTGIDWQPEALALGRQLADSRDVAVDFRVGDLRDPATVEPGPWSLVVNFRYLQRDLLARLDRLMGPGGVALVRTFRSAPGYEGHPRPRYRLEPGELLRAFPRGKWRVLVHESSHDADGRPAAGIVAQRKIISAG